MQFIDLKSQYKRIDEEVRTRIDSILEGQRYVMGQEVQELETQLAEFAGVKHVLSCSSGTDALLIALMAHGLKENDAVFVPSFTFFATAEAVTLAGATPVFVDSDADTFNISCENLTSAIEKTKAEGVLNPRGIIPVDLFGHLADYEAIDAIAQAHDLFVLEDACQGFGAMRAGRRAGAYGNVGVTSFFPAKPLGCYGDGGAIFTDSDELADLMRSIRVHGQGVDKYDNVRIGINGRLDTIQAAVLLSKLSIFEDELVARARVASWYTERLCEVLDTPVLLPGDTSAWAQYTLKAKDAAQRQKIIEGMKEKGIPTAVYYPIPIHFSTAYADLGYKRGSLPVCEDAAERVFSLPMHPYLTETDVEEIASAVKECL